MLAAQSWLHRADPHLSAGPASSRSRLCWTDECKECGCLLAEAAWDSEHLQAARGGGSGPLSEAQAALPAASALRFITKLRNDGLSQRSELSRGRRGVSTPGLGGSQGSRAACMSPGKVVLPLAGRSAGCGLTGRSLSRASNAPHPGWVRTTSPLLQCRGWGQLLESCCSLKNLPGV